MRTEPLTRTERRTAVRLVTARERELAEVAAAMRHEGNGERPPFRHPADHIGPADQYRDERRDYGCYRVLPDGTRVPFQPTRGNGPTRGTRPTDARRAALARLLAIIGTSQADYD